MTTPYRNGTIWTGDGDGATVAALADGLAILADKLLSSTLKCDARQAGEIATWLDRYRSSGELWTLWRTSLLMVGPLVPYDFQRIKEATAGRI